MIENSCTASDSITDVASEVPIGCESIGEPVIVNRVDGAAIPARRQARRP